MLVVSEKCYTFALARSAGGSCFSPFVSIFAGLVAQLVRATDSSSGGPWFKPRLGHPKESPNGGSFCLISLDFHSRLSPSFKVRSNFVDNEPSVDGSLRDKSQAQAGPQRENRSKWRFSFVL